MYRSFLLLAIMMAASVIAADLVGVFDVQPGGARPTPAARVATFHPTDAPKPTENAGGDREILVSAGPDGHFRMEADVNGETISFMVDTGATVVALSPADARRLGFDDTVLEFTGSVRTANGVAPVAPVTLDEVSISALTVRDVGAVVTRQPMSVSLLGMSFLSRLDGYEVRDDRLVLRW